MLSDLITNENEVTSREKIKDDFYVEKRWDLWPPTSYFGPRFPGHQSTRRNVY